MTVIAGSSSQKSRNFMTYCPSIDVLGINTYSGAAGCGEMLKSIGYNGFAVTEFGPAGHWEVAKTAWGAPIEPTSFDKAVSYRAAHTLVFERNDGKELCLGTFAFLWGWKQETTATWYGMYLPSMENLAQVDAMTKAWTGSWPENSCPHITALSSDARHATVNAEQILVAKVEVKEYNNDPVTYAWSLLAETTQHGGSGKTP